MIWLLHGLAGETARDLAERYGNEAAERELRVGQRRVKGGAHFHLSEHK